MPARSDTARVELGRIALAATPQLLLQDVDGKPRANVQGKLLRAGYGNFTEQRLPMFPFDDAGRWLGPALLPGDGIFVAADAEGVLPLRHVVTSGAPTVARTPAGRLALRIVDTDGAPLVATVMVRECAFRCQGSIELRQLPTEPLRLFVATAGHRGARVEVTPTREPTAAIDVVLPKQ